MQKFFGSTTRTMSTLSALAIGGSLYFFLKKSKDNEQLSPERWVDVYVWWSKRAAGDTTNAGKVAFKQYTKGEEANFGHAVIVTSEGLYASYWPKRGECGHLKKPVRGEHMSNIQQDIENEGGAPDVRARFYSLDNHAISKAFVKTEQETEGWALKGPVGKNQYRGQSCVTYVLALLRAGGIDTLSRSTDFSNKNFLGISPYTLSHYVLKANQAERRIYPQTKAWAVDQGFQDQDENEQLITKKI